MRLTLCGAAIAVMLLVAGCGGGSSSSGSSSSSKASTHASGGGSATRTTAGKGPASYVYVTMIPKPRGPGPHPGARVDRLVVRDVRKGIGPEIHAGDTGTFEFIATDWVTGRPIESSWQRPRQFETQIEHNVVIDGWWQGIPGMRVGGRRQIVIPPALGFTTNPNLQGATTYFDVVLNKFTPQQPRALAPGGAASGAGGSGGSAAQSSAAGASLG